MVSSIGSKKVRAIMLISTAITLVILVILAFNIKKIQNINKIELAKESETISNPNNPKISAGMIPVKYVDGYWTITTKEDLEWYDYLNNRPAYVMLNDGVYQSELMQDMNKNGQKLAKEYIGAQIKENELGSIYMWIPRFEIDETNKIKYIQDIGEAEENFAIPDFFMYKQKEETKPDFLLTGTWIEINPDTEYKTKIANMNKENNSYGFIANTISTSFEDSAEKSIIETYIEKFLENNIIYNDVLNYKRITLKVVNENATIAMKTKAEFTKDTGLITVEITYSKYGINKILLNKNQELTFNKENGIIKANTLGIALDDGKNTIIIEDKNGNVNILKVEVINNIYVTLYTDGTLAFGKTENPLPEKTISTQYGVVPDNYDSTGYIKWYSNKNVKTADFVDKITPRSTKWWFGQCTNLTEIKNIENLNTKYVTTMRGMFYDCTSITSLDLSSFDTSNVVNMYGMFWGAEKLTTLNISGFNTSNVTDMAGMFAECYALTALDLSSFDTSNTTTMEQMFQYCRKLTTLDLSSFDTSNVTNMRGMFDSCDSLESVTMSNFDTSNVITMRGMFYACWVLESLDLSSFNTHKVESMYYMFGNCYKLKAIYVGENWTTQNADTTGIFSSCGTSKVTQI